MTPPLADRRVRAPARGCGGARGGVRGRQRLPRHPRHARGGRPVARPRRDPQRLPRDVADRLPRGRLRPRADRPDHRQRHRRLGHPALRRRRAVRRRDRPRAPLRARARHADGRARAARSSSRRRRAAGCSCARAGSRRSRTATSPPSTTRSLALDAAVRIDALLGARHPRPAPRAATTRAAARASPRRCSSRSPRTRSSAARSLHLAHAHQRARAGVRDGPRHRGQLPGHGRDERRRRRRAGRSCAPSSRPAGRCGCASTSPTTGARARPRASCCARVDRTLDRAAPRRLRAHRARPRAGASTTSGTQRRRSSRARPALQQAVRFNLFQLLQATARGEGHGVAAKGVTGHGYEGHYFWDTEIYVLPFLTHTQPASGRGRLLDFRVGMLDAARRARARGRPLAARCSRGARSTARRPRRATPPAPRSTTSTPTSPTRCTSTTASPATTSSCSTRAPRCWSRRRASGCGSGFFSERRDGQFCINGVTGPDEYTTVVDNNAYTNLMAKREPRGRHARGRVAARAPTRRPRARSSRDRPPDAEVDEWRRAAERMYVPRDERLGVRPAGRALPRPQALGLRGHAAREATRCCCTTTRSRSTATRSSSRPTWCSRRTSPATTSRPRRSGARSTTTTR